MVGFNINFKNIINNIKTTILSVFLYITDVEDIWADIQAKCGLWIDAELIHLSDGLVYLFVYCVLDFHFNINSDKKKLNLKSKVIWNSCSKNMCLYTKVTENITPYKLI